MKQLWENGGDIGDIPTQHNVLEPEEPQSQDRQVIRKYKQHLKKIRQTNAELHSLR